MTKYIHSGSHIKTLLKNSSWYFISSILSKGLGIILMPIMTRLLTTTDYGLLSNLNAIIGFVTVFISLYIDSAFNRFYFEHNESQKSLKEYISTFFWFVTFWGAFVTFILIIVSKFYLASLYSIKFFPLLFGASIIPLFIQLAAFGSHYLRNNLKIKLIVIPNLVISILTIIVSIFLIIKFDLGVVGRFYGILLGVFLSFIYFTFILIQKKLIIFYLDKKLIIAGLKYSLPLVPLALSSWITQLSDRIILTYYTDFSETGLYDVAYKASLTLRIFTESIFQVYSPMMISMYTHDKEAFRSKLKKFIPQFNWIMLFAAFYLAILSKEIIIILTGSKFHSAYTLVPIIVFAYYISSHQKYFGSIFGLKKKTYLSTVGYFLQALINLTLNIIFIPILGKVAAAWSTFFSLFFLTIWSGFWFFKWESVKIEWNKIIKTFLILIIVYIVYLGINTVFKYTAVPMFFIKLLITAPVILFFTYKFEIINIKGIMGIFNKKGFK
ncbi:oligosaccharide flippase family protein [bacterium]|jgi:O-antigen/teichoic acid export membrane protein|nr:oligosaccharide flippase family protein [bacterium]MBT3581948.1 oligosaccharide flippase family protein [bacterium]MBT4551699.1 oligosaccharide flippase family protein [bacterium]